MTDTPILRRLEDKRVFSVTPMDEGGFYIQEQCDTWFAVELTREELIALAEELRAMALAERSLPTMREVPELSEQQLALHTGMRRSGVFKVPPPPKEQK